MPLYVSRTDNGRAADHFMMCVQRALRDGSLDSLVHFLGKLSSGPYISELSAPLPERAGAEMRVTQRYWPHWPISDPADYAGEGDVCVECLLSFDSSKSQWALT